MNTYELIDKYIGAERRERILLMLASMMSDGVAPDAGPREMLFDRAPCSGRYHDSCSGGLLKHSLRVVVNMLRLRKALKVDVSEESCVLVALFHDLGKVGDGTQPYYLPQTNRWRVDNLGERYYSNPKIGAPHHFLSIFLLQKWGIGLTAEEHKAILCHNGLYTPAAQEIQHKEGALSLLLHWADMWEVFGQK